MQILQNGEFISFLFEQSTMFQAVNTEGLPHRKDWPSTWFGDSRGKWDGDTLVIEVTNLNGFTKLDTIGHPMSDQSKLTMTFKRPDMGHIQFKWVLEDPKTYTRPISNERVFVLTPDDEVMEYACMESNLQSLIDRSITPWLGAKDHDENLIYDKNHDWSAYDSTKPQNLTGIIKEISYSGPFPLMKIEANQKLMTIVLAPAVRMDFRGLTAQMLKPGASVTAVAYPSRQATGEFRAQQLTVGGRATEMR
jgi:hypothetical protein